MAVRPVTGLRPAVCLRKRTGPLSGDQGQAPDIEPFFMQKREGLQGHRPRHSPGCQIKDPLRLLFADGFEGRKQDGHGLAGARGRLQEQLFPMYDRPINAGRQFILPLPIGEGKGHLPDGVLPCSAKGQAQPNPGRICPDQRCKPFFKMVKRHFFIKAADLTCRLAAIGHADLHPVQAFPACKHIGVAPRLRQVDLLGALHAPQSSGYCLNLINGPEAVRKRIIRRLILSLLHAAFSRSSCMLITNLFKIC